MNDNPHYVTPEEARRMDCAQTPSDRTCSGPGCMAWRWSESSGKVWFWAETELQPEPKENWIPIELFKHGDRKAGKFQEKPTHGYCGMVRS
jgi:hypothetical protein